VQKPQELAALEHLQAISGLSWSEFARVLGKSRTWFARILRFGLQAHFTVNQQAILVRAGANPEFFHSAHASILQQGFTIELFQSNMIALMKAAAQ